MRFCVFGDSKFFPMSVYSEYQKNTKQGSPLDRCNEEIILKTDIGNKFESPNTKKSHASLTVMV